LEIADLDSPESHSICKMARTRPLLRILETNIWKRQ